MGGRIDAIWGLFSSFGGFSGWMVIIGQWSSKSTFGAYNVEAWNNKPKCKWSPQEGGNEEESYLRIEDLLQSRSCDQFSDALLSTPAAADQVLDRTHELKERDKSTPRPCGQHAGRKPAPLFPSSPSPACHRRSPPRSVLSSQLYIVQCSSSNFTWVEIVGLLLQIFSKFRGLAFQAWRCLVMETISYFYLLQSHHKTSWYSQEVTPVLCMSQPPWKAAGRFEPRKLGECLLVDRTPHTLEPSSFCRVNQNKDKCLCLITPFLPYTGIWNKPPLSFLIDINHGNQKPFSLIWVTKKSNKSLLSLQLVQTGKISSLPKWYT